MNSKRLLVIQLDGPYFLNETLRVLEKHLIYLKEFELTVLVDSEALLQVSKDIVPMVPGITINKDLVTSQSYDLSFNFSLDEKSWTFYSKVNSTRKHGPEVSNGKLLVTDIWSTYLLTLKAQTPFLTFHLQDIYKNILGIKKLTESSQNIPTIKEIVFGKFNPNFCADTEAKLLFENYKFSLPQICIKKIEETDLISDLSHTLYIGPATFDALKLCEAGACGIFIGSRFQGLNLLPHDGNHFSVSTRGEKLTAAKIIPFIDSILKNGKPAANIEYSLYELAGDNLFGTYLRSLNTSDEHYPFYQSHVVLWNFLLNLFDINLEVTHCSAPQIDLLIQTQKVLSKVIRLQEYALRSIDIVYHEAKSASSNGEKIDGHLKNLSEIETILSQIAESHPMLRSFLDFYHMRRGQNDGNTLLEQAQHSLLVYSEEHHALTALNELFSVTLRKNEVSI